MRCDCRRVIAAAKQVHLQVPLVVRMKGTNEELGKMLAESGLPIGLRTPWRRRQSVWWLLPKRKPIPTGDGMGALANRLRSRV